MTIRPILLIAVLASLLLPAAPAVAAGPPVDYTKIDGLSTAQYETRRETVRLPAYDGKELYLEIVRPRAEGRFPVILESSPYHGTLADRDGTRILPGPKGADGKPIGLTGYFAPRGYAVVMMDLRGTGRSQGCLDHLGPKDGRDLKQVVEWSASRDWSNGKVGMTGHSYVGSTPTLAAAQNPQGLATIVPSAGLASMYHRSRAAFPTGCSTSARWRPTSSWRSSASSRRSRTRQARRTPGTTSPTRWRRRAVACPTPR